MMKYDVDYMLGHAYCKEYYDDTDARRIYEAALLKTACRKPKRRRFIPVLACVFAALIVISAVPPVRAAVMNFFESVGTYMASGPERPAVTGVDVQTPKTGEQKTEAKRDWINGITVSIEEALFDGEKLYLSYTVQDPNHVLTPEEEHCSTDHMEIGQTVHERLFGKGIAFENGIQMADGYDYRADYEDGVFRMTTMFTAENSDQLKGRQNAALILNFIDQYITKTGEDMAEIRADEGGAGTISVPFSIEADASLREISVADIFPINGNATVTARTLMGDKLVNTPVCLDGTKLIFDEIKVKATEIVLQMTATPPAGLEDAETIMQLGFKAYADGELLSGAYMDYAQMDGVNGSCEMKYTIPFPPQDLKTLELVPFIEYNEKVNGEPVPENVVYTISETEWATVERKEQLLEQSVITIDLS